MSSVSHQTIKLSRGKHTSPAEGACVMELASMLAGEPFSDHPASVCPVLASLLREYNDLVDDSRRQDLYVYAAAVVGTTGSPVVQRARAERLTAWAVQMQKRRWPRSLLPARLRAIGIERDPPIDRLGIQAVRPISSRLTDEAHAAVRSLIDELLAMGTSKKSSPPPTVPEWGLREAAF